MIKLRLKRYGKKREASYRIVAMNSRDRRDGRPIEELGFYNPRTDETRLNADAILRRLQQGAQPTQTVRDILRKANLLGGGAATAVATPEAPPAPETPVPEPVIDDAAESSSEVAAVETPEEPAAAETPEEPAVAETSEEPAAAETPEEPAVAETPEEPAAAETPEEPAVAETPEEPAADDAVDDTSSESEQPATA